MAWRRNLALAAFVALAACKRNPSKLDPPPEPPGHRIALDGELAEPAWNDRALRGIFKGEAGGQSRPYSELRLLRDDTHLLVGLYAADEDIRSTDAFELQLGPTAVRLTAAGTATPASVRVAVDRDGTLDDPRDDDEEWVIEAAIPLSALGPPPIPLTATRCDVTKDGVHRCGTWSGTIDPQALALIQ